MSSDNSNDSDWFDKCIEYDEVRTNSDSEKENNSTIVMKQPKTTKNQFKKIDAFMEEHDVELLGKETYKLLWDDLAAKLNDIGPPVHSVTAWKRIWTVHKHYVKRKRPINESDTEEPRKMVCLDKPSSSQSMAVSNVGLSQIPGQLPSPSNSINVSNVPLLEISGQLPSPSQSIAVSKGVVGLSEISGQLTVIIENQSKMEVNQTLLLQELQSSNKLLQKLVKKA